MQGTVHANKRGQLSDVGVWNDACELASLGLRVFHVRPRSKVPQLRDWPNRATSNLEVLSRWAVKHPDANLGIAMGDGVLALDVDDKAGGFGSLRGLQAKYGELPVTACSRTGGGGRHFLFRVEPGLRIPNSQGGHGGLAPGLDVRGDGGQIVAPPSVHESGQRYTWERHPREGIELAPDWLLSLITRPPRTEVPSCTLAHLKKRAKTPKQAKPTASKRAEPLAGFRRIDPTILAGWFVRDFPILARGRRHALMFRAAQQAVGRGYVDEDISEALCIWWRRFRALELTMTSADRHMAEVRATLRGLRSHPDAEVWSVWHESRIAGIDLGPALCSLLRLPNFSKSSVFADGSGTHPNADLALFCSADCDPRNGSDPSSVFAGLTELECIYVGSLVAQSAYCLNRYGMPVRFTDEQLSRTAAARFGRSLSRGQTDFLKPKFTTTLPTRNCCETRPASKVELLRQTERGAKTTGAAAGTPSSYAIMPSMRALFTLGVAVDGRPLNLEDFPCVASIPA